MLNLFDSILGAISYFDLLTPLVGLLQNLVRGPSFTYRIPHRAGFGIYTVESILKDEDCAPVWGKHIFNSTMLLTVKQEHAQRGYWALKKAGVPMENSIPKGAKNQRQNSKAEGDWLDALSDFLDL